MIKSSLLFFSVLLIFSTAPLNVSAKAFKCVGDNGEITYSQTACMNSQTTEKVMGGGGKTTSMEDCKYARQFAEGTANKMQSGVDVHQTFDHYGGVDSISKSTLAIINYVYSYNDVPDVSAARIGSLTAASCNAKAFGTVSCEDFPYEFRTSVNGCGQEQLDQTPEAAPPIEPVTNPETDANNTKAQDDRLKKRKSEQKKRAQEKIQDCKQTYDSQIKSIDDKMREAYSATEGERLREKRRQLQQRKADECR